MVILQGSGKISNERMKDTVKKIYATFDQRRKIAEAAEAEALDALDATALKTIVDKLKGKN